MKYAILLLLIVIAAGCTVKPGAGKFSLCGGNISDAANCYITALANNDESACEGLKGVAASGCYYAMAMKFNNSLLCENAEDKWKDLCFYTLAVTQNSHSLCEKIQNITMAVECKSS